MKPEQAKKAAAEVTSDRRIIRVELPPAHAGVTAALRRAFSASPLAVDHEFDELLNRLR